MADRDHLYKAWLAAVEKTDETAVAEARAKLKLAEARVTEKKAEKAHDAAFAAHRRALEAAEKAHLDWSEAKAAGL